MAENAAVFDFEISDEDMKAIDALDKHRKFNDPAIYSEGGFKTFCPIFD